MIRLLIGQWIIHKVLAVPEGATLYSTQAADLKSLHLFGLHLVRFVQHQRVGCFDLFHQQVHHVPIFAGTFAIRVRVSVRELNAE